MEKAIEQQWNAWLQFDADTRAELCSIQDEAELHDRFYKELAFGTGGLRGIMGAGTNRMNRYTVGKATYGIANYLRSQKAENSVVLAYDSRNNSAAFAKIAAGIFAACGCKVYLFDRLVPVPVLSFSVAHLACDAGVMITASHNPKEYNGYKVFDRTGCQLCTEDALEAMRFIRQVEDFSSIPFSDNETGVTYIGDEVLRAYYAAVAQQSLYTEKSDLKIVYTPLHGTGNLPVRTMLAGMDVTVVKAQELPDGNFSTVRSPNPEEKDALNLAIETAKTIGADLVLGTDPDCDRVGIAVKDREGHYVLMTGNQTGALLIRFVLAMKQGQLSPRATIVKTIVTSELGAEIARKQGLLIENTLTGFKYIGDKINQYEQSGSHDFLLGYEESYGYLIGKHARDKDAVVSSMLICQMAAYYKNRGKNLCDVLEEVYAEFGFYLDSLDSFVFLGEDGAKKIEALMCDFRSRPDDIFDSIEKVIDYAVGVDDLPRENVLKFLFGGGTWIAVRPSGTEPKIKVYYSVNAGTKAAAAAQLAVYKAAINRLIGEKQ